MMRLVPDEAAADAEPSGENGLVGQASEAAAVALSTSHTAEKLEAPMVLLARLLLEKLPAKYALALADAAVAAEAAQQVIAEAERADSRAAEAVTLAEEASSKAGTHQQSSMGIAAMLGTDRAAAAKVLQGAMEAAIAGAEQGAGVLAESEALLVEQEAGAVVES